MYTSMYLTELQVKRRIWVYLPADYAYSGKRYPVLYMQDGQNLFDVKSSFSGEWMIDEYLDSIDFAGIVIGIDNGGESRILEYNPNHTKEHGKGLGREYLHRVVTILKPFVDEHFRTLPEPENTAIAGSSMGGLITFYAGLFYPEVFGIVGVFSPSFWLVPELEEEVKKMSAPTHKKQRYFFYAGERESEDLIERVENIASLVKTQFSCEVMVHVHEKGRHTESSWRRMFPDFYQWLHGRHFDDES